MLCLELAEAFYLDGHCSLCSPSSATYALNWKDWYLTLIVMRILAAVHLYFVILHLETFFQAFIN